MDNRYLYRAKMKNKNEWALGSLVHVPHQDKYYILRHTENEMFEALEECEVDPSTICQCTGLKDNHGKLIWENDILVGYLDDMYPENATYAQVIWDKNGFYTKEQYSDDISLMDEFDEKHFEVCGNIFDNPELLEVGE